MRRLGLVLAVALAGCAAPAAPGGEGSGAVAGDITVFAAASLSESFTAIGEQFEHKHPGAEVTFSFGASTALAQAVVAGAPADVYASASPEAMKVVTRDGAAAGRPLVIARNQLRIAVPAGNPGGVTGLQDFADPDLTIALCARQVPCGAAAVQVLEAAGVVAAADTLEQDVKAALSKVALGEVDAALVYRTDVLAAGDAVEGLDVPGAAAAANDYSVVVLEQAPNAAAARAFVALVASDDGRRSLSAAGFELP
jgi:molybdate transport system substrate-binding protein